MAALRVDDVGKRFGDRVALKDVTFEAAPGERIAVIGPNGAGKTTMLSVIAGILTADVGTVSRAPEEIGWVPQQAAIYSKLSVAENLRLFARLEKVADVEATVNRMLDQTDLRDRADDEVGQLSGGNQQRVNIAIGLLSAPPILLLDEPSSALDPRQRARLWDFIEALSAAGTTVIFATHDIAEAERHSVRVLVLADGELLFNGTPDELEDAAAVETTDFETAFVGFLRDKGH